MSLFFLSILLLSCEGSTDIYKSIENNSSETITVSGSIPGVSDYNKTIEPGQTELLYLGGDGMGASDIVEDPALGIDSLIITIGNNDTCRKDYHDQSNWEIGVGKTRKTPARYRHNYIFIVNDSDF